VYLEGKIETREYTDKDGIVKRAMNIVAREMNLVGSANSSGNGGGYGDGGGSASEPDYTAASARSNDVPVNLAPSGDDDLPF